MHFKKRRALLNIALLAMTALLVSACGGGASESGDTATATNTATTPQTNQVATQRTLTVSMSSGVTGTPATTTSYANGATLNYSFSLQSGYTNLQITLDGVTAPASGTITMSAAHQLQVSALPLQSNITPKLLVAVFMHSEDPFHPATPDFIQDAISYRSYRAALLDFAARMDQAGLAWNFQPDWNFLNGIIEYEMTHPDVALLAATANKNILRYMHENLGVEIDPHSHENGGYNYADVAYLISQIGVSPAPVVGGHIYSPNDANYQNWPRFISGITCEHFSCPAWRAELLMGSGSTDHQNDPVVTGMWQPASEDAYHTPGSSGIVAFGGWDNEITSVSALADQVQSGALDTTLLWTFSLNVNHSDVVQAGFLDNTMQPKIDQLVALKAASRIDVVTFVDALDRWRNDYGQRPSVYQPAPSSSATRYVSFALNTQDFAYVAESAALVTRVLDLHEALNVPLDVFLTTTQVDLFEAEQPALLQRLLTSPVVTLSYHVRAPKPYANNYDWRGVSDMSYDEQVALITDYETHGLDLTTGAPTTASGGFQKLASLWGKAPRMCGTMWDAAFAQAAADVFGSLGCSMAIEHGRAVNAGENRYGLWIKPEHVDFRLFEYVGQDGAAALDSAIVSAQTAAGVRPAFVGVKMHDNDFFASQSAWTYVYQDGGRRRPNWDPTRKPALLTSDEQTAMWTLYEATVRHAAALRTAGSIQLVDADDLIALAIAAGP
jgi:hypothetical protein